MKGRPVPEKATEVPTLYEAHTPMDSEFWVEQVDDQVLYELGDTPSRPYLVFRSAPYDGSDADAAEMVIDYEQLDEVIHVLMHARDLVPPASQWKKVDGRLVWIGGEVQS